MDQRVTGIGGIFFKAKDPKTLGQWYARHLGLQLEPEGEFSIFRWREGQDPERQGATVWAAFSEDTAYFGPGDSQFMINYRVEDLDALLTLLRAEGIEEVGEILESEHGRFAWIRDPEGRRIELWQPPVDY